ncbi:MAG TPA: fasciclin domain-containing protein [Solirubrobacteraceae bacterium]|nr:fasciclin domain-containing protein [Solirubrobacteraceae bacterium]
MKRIAVLLSAVLAIAVPVATSASAQAGGMTAQKNIVALAASDPQLSTLVSLVKKAGLVKALSGTTKLTVFAPTNAAFAAVPKATLAKLARNKKELAGVLDYHVVPGVVTAAQAEMLKSAKTLEGKRLKIAVRGGHVFINDAKVIKANVMASNGVVHIINRVLLP